MKPFGLKLFIAALCAMGAAGAGAAPAGLSDKDLRVMASEFEALTGFKGRARAMTARVETVQAPGPGGRIGASRRLAGLPPGLDLWALGPGAAAGRSALMAVSAGEGPRSVCAVIQAPENLPGSREQRLREALSAEAGRDAWKWLVAHEFGHCAHGFLRAQREASPPAGADEAGEAFADVFAMEWAMRRGGASEPGWGPALIKARAAEGLARVGRLERYWRERSNLALGGGGRGRGSICQVALHYSTDSGARAVSGAKLSC